MFALAVAREFIERTPLQQGNESLVKEELEDNRRHRRLAIGEEKALSDANVLEDDGLSEGKDGVGNGVRTRDFRSHSPALYH
jgi:hypothetical protein